MAAAQDRQCPGERYPISLAICRTRQRNQYPKCLLCPHRDPELVGTTTSDPKVSSSIFRSTGVLGHVPREMNEYVMRKIGLAAGQLLRAEHPSGSRMVVACDLRNNSRGFTRIFCEGVNRAGMDTVNVGPSAPEVLAYVLGTDGCTGAAYVSGGDYAHDVNGVRLWRGNGQPLGLGNGLEKIRQIVRRMRTGRSRLPGETTAANPIPEYVAHMQRFGMEFSPLKMVVDGGYGVARRLLERLFVNQPVEVVAVHFNEDGQNPFLGRRFPSNSLLASMRGEVQNARADLGVALDFSAERIAFFDEKGALLPHDTAAAFIATEVLRRNDGGGVAYDLRATAALAGAISQSGGQPLPGPASPLAFAQHVADTEALYGADRTGLHYFKELFGAPSSVAALLLFCCHVCRQEKGVSALAAPLERLSRSDEIVVAAASAEDAAEALERVQEEFADSDSDRLDGLTVRTRDYWFNLRQPGGAAELRLIVEGRTSRDQRKGRQTVERILQKVFSARS